LAEHTHAKDLTFRERSEAIMLRSQINAVHNRFIHAQDGFNRAHNSGYCAFEMGKFAFVMKKELATLIQLLDTLGNVEHYNYESILAQAEEGS
jgi:hypothetical protein